MEKLHHPSFLLCFFFAGIKTSFSSSESKEIFPLPYVSFFSSWFISRGSLEFFMFVASDQRKKAVDDDNLFVGISFEASFFRR